MGEGGTQACKTPSHALEHYNTPLSCTAVVPVNITFKDSISTLTYK